MALFPWDNKYSVNNEKLDNHHRALFAIINRLYESCMDKNSNVTLGPIIEELTLYTIYHFAAEEKYMRNIGYKGTDKHIAEHKIFKDRISHLEQKKDIDDIVVTKELIVYLGNWLLNHVIVEDKKYGITHGLNRSW